MLWLELALSNSQDRRILEKIKKVTLLIDSGSTHNFIHCKVAKDIDCFVYTTPKFQVMIADGGVRIN